MKLRIKGNTVRLRLTQSEVTRLGAEGRVEEEVLFAPGVSLRYAIEARDELTEPRAEFEEGGVRVVVPGSDARRWIASDAAAMAGEQPNGTDEPLRILIEKDFACLHRDAEDADAFPNPAHA